MDAIRAFGAGRYGGGKLTRTFQTGAAVRAQVNLIIGLVGPSSSGKTYTALELATGIQTVTGGDIEMIDTEHGRGLFYADKFKFNHTPFVAPFASLDYLDAIRQAAKRAKIIIVDSMSHEHESEGGMIDFQEAELTRMAGDDFRKRERMQMLAWAKPKAARRKLLQGLTQVDAHIILCFRAKNSSKPGKDANGKAVVIPMGFVPIAGEEFVFEAALSALLPPNSRGVPNWTPDMPGEKIAVKLPQQFEWLAQRQGPLTRGDGAKLAEWARGGAAPAKVTPKAAAETDTADPDPSWPDTYEHRIDTATDFHAFNAYLKSATTSPEYAAMKAHDEPRASMLREKAETKRKELHAVLRAAMDGGEA